MTVKKIREILGSKVGHLSDKDLFEFIQRTDKALDAIFRQAVKKSHEKKQKG